MLKKLTSGISAGILIGIGGSVFLGCVALSNNKFIGAVLFSVALLCICYKGYALFTGKVGFLPEDHSKDAIVTLIFALIGNTIGAVGTGLAIHYTIPGFGRIAYSLCDSKLDNQKFWQAFVLAVFCGILMYLAVSIFKYQKTPLGILFCIPTFILAAFEHSIADMFYISAGGYFRLKSLLYLFLVVLGNAVGGVLLPLLNGIWNKREDEIKPEQKQDGSAS